MSMFLMIQNAGVAPIESFTMLGLSTARDKSDKIGQFGSGAKHGILQCLRAGMTPIIYLGKDNLEFCTEDSKMGNTPYKRVCYLWQGVFERLSVSLDFGGVDWNDFSMGLREFVSNAIDACDFSDVVVKLTSEAVPYEGKTTIYVPLTDEVRRFYDDIKNRFLHFSGKHEKTFMPASSAGECKVYRKGVFVRAIASKALCDYNFGDKLKIDECRNMDEYSAMAAIGKEITCSDDNTIKSFLNNLSNNSDCLEGKIPSYYLVRNTDMPKLFKECFGQKALVDSVNSGGILAERATRKGYEVIKMPTEWNTYLQNCGVPSVLSVLDDTDAKGRIFLNCPLSLEKRVDKIWGKIVSKGLHMGRNKPTNIKMFESPMSGESMEYGFWNRADNSINIHKDYIRSNQTILEELAHYITGATDNSRDFQDYAFKLATAFMGLK